MPEIVPNLHPLMVHFPIALITVSAVFHITAWHGGELVYRHGLGVMSLPVPQDGAGHGHHGDSATSSDEYSQHDHTH